MTKSLQQISPVEVVTLRITQDDLRDAERYGITNPIIYALQRATSTLWRISDCGVGLEVTPPYRTCVLSSRILEHVRNYQTTGTMPECEFDVELRSDIS